MSKSIQFFNYFIYISNPTKMPTTIFYYLKIMNEYIRRRKDNISGTLNIELPKILNVKEQEYIVNIIRKHIK